MMLGSEKNSGYVSLMHFTVYMNKTLFMALSGYAIGIWTFRIPHIKIHVFIQTW